ncbi:MAG: extracellular solute-binding protein [Clostridia bacterium]|nr:extracellular solute-binding protein [Clostridia bacterium]
MKKRLHLILIALVWLLVLAGCQASETMEKSSVGVVPSSTETSSDPLRICVDLAYLGIENVSPDYSHENAVENAVQGLMLNLAEKGQTLEYEIEVIPKEETARKSMLTRLRTEMMSGEGPDVFIMGCAGGPLGDDADALFSVPEKAMENALFLPLDEYMESRTQYTEWDKQLSVVMDAGRNESGQLIVPLSYTMPVAFYRAEDITEKPDAATTWQDMLEDESGILPAAAEWNHMRDGFVHMHGNYIEYTFGQLADYESEELTFSEEELFARIEEIYTLNQEYAAGKYSVPAHYQTCLSVDFNNASGANLSFAQGQYTAEEDPFCGIKPLDTQTMVPVYSDDGGAVAVILAYAAVNINTRDPEGAFAVIDILMDRKTQQSAVLYTQWFTQLYGMPMHTDLLQPQYPMMNISGGKTWYLSEENYAEYCRLREQITHARFRGGLDIELNDAYYAYEKAVRNGESAEKQREIAAEYYSRTKRLLGE